MQEKLSDYILGALEENNLELIKILRNGDRFACLMVKAGDSLAMFKIVRPWNELPPLQSVTELSERLIKEASFLQYMSAQIDDTEIFYPQVITYSDTRPAWSLRQFIEARSMSFEGSTFRFKDDFFEQVSPLRVIKFFGHLHHLSPTLPQNLDEQMQKRRSTLLEPDRIQGHFDIVATDERLSPMADLFGRFIENNAPKWQDYQKVIAHYEPYSCHFFLLENKLGLIDWENVGWSHNMQDFSVVWMRAFEHPRWQSEFIDALEKRKYFEGTGRLMWDSEILLQSISNLMHFSLATVGPPEFHDKANSFFLSTFNEILKRYEG